MEEIINLPGQKAPNAGVKTFHPNEKPDGVTVK